MPHRDETHRRRRAWRIGFALGVAALAAWALWQLDTLHQQVRYLQAQVEELMWDESKQLGDYLPSQPTKDPNDGRDPN